MRSGLIFFAGYREVAKSAALVLAMPCGLNTIIFPKLVGEDCEIGASLACVSTILSCISIPLVLAVFGVR
jgi:predicted permease